MARTGRDTVDRDGYIRDGYDYELQVWTTAYIIQAVGQAKALAGRDIRTITMGDGYGMPERRNQ